MSERKLVESTPFSIDARVAIQLGRESISSSLVAISELVKNSYDADAENVFIKLYRPNTASATLIIEDNGNGMDSDLLKKNWLRIGTDIKARTEISEVKHRVLTGSKGLGRLGIDRLCKKMILQTKTRNSSIGIELEIDWDSYDQSYGNNLENIKHNIYEIPSHFHDNFGQFPTKGGLNGTRLILTGLKDDWTEDFTVDLKNELSRLVSPFKAIKDFSIWLKTGFPKADGKIISKQYLKVAEAKLHSFIDNNNMVSLEVSSSFYNRQYKQEPISWKDWIPSRDTIPRCGPLRLEMYYIPDRPNSVLQNMDFDRNIIKDFVRNNQGIRIYRDQFRVKPYGEPSGDGDWLRLSYRRATQPQAITQLGWRVALHQVIGAVFITRASNPELIDQTNREGLVETPPFFDLKAFADKSIQIFEHYLHQWASEQKGKREVEKAKQALDDSNFKSFSEINDLKQKVQILEMTPEAITEKGKIHTLEISRIIESVEKTINNSVIHQKNYEKILEDEANELQQEKDTLSNLASLGILTVSFGHEIKGAANVAAMNSIILKNSFSAGRLFLLPDEEANIKEKLEMIIRNTEYVNVFANFALANIKWDKRKRHLIRINDICKYVISCFSLSLLKKNISVDSSDISENIPAILGFAIDWESIFVNFITNSVWALEDTPAEKRKISISISYADNNIITSFADSGRGLEKGTESMIFLPTFSTKRNEKGEQIGTGMGLSIVKTFIEDHAKGSITVKSPGRLDGAEFIIKIPYENIRGKNEPK